MGKYCDPKILESTWLAFMLAYRTPELNDIRNTGLLFTQYNNCLKHCVASTQQYSFTADNDIISAHDLNNATKASFYPLDLTLAHRLVDDNYTHEVPIEESWHGLTSMVYKICCGVALNFRPPNDDVKNELIQEAFAHTLTKIHRNKLRMEPGRAPAFNLLTTAIFRIMYSIKNKEKRNRDHKSQLVEQLVCGNKLPDFNSIRVSKSLIGHAKIKT